MLKNSLFVALTVIAFSASGQSNLRDGYVITLQKDTLNGKVDFTYGKARFEVCRFIQNGTTVEYSPSSISGYGFIGDAFYQAGVIPNVFVEVLIAGPLTLYKHGGKFYFKKDGQELFSPEENLIEVPAGAPGNPTANPATIRDVRWKGRLAAMLNDCKISQNVFANLELTERSLLKLAVKYNQCRSASALVFKENTPWVKVNVGVSVGIVRTIMRTVEGYDDAYDHMLPLYQSTNPGFGALLTFASPKVDQRLAFSAGLSFNRASFASANSTPNVFEKTTYYTTSFSTRVISVPLSIHYALGGRKFSPLTEVSVVYDNVNSTSLLNVREVRNVTTAYYTRPAFTFRNSQLGVAAGLGLAFNGLQKIRPSIGVKYFRMGRMNNDPGLKVNASRLAISLTVVSK